jgi:hypothetical protein
MKRIRPGENSGIASVWYTVLRPVYQRYNRLVIGMNVLVARSPNSGKPLKLRTTKVVLKKMAGCEESSHWSRPLDER